MFSTFGSVPILTVVAIQLFLIRNVLSLNLTNAYLHHKCNNTQGIYKRGSAFEKNLNIALRTVIFNGDFRTGFRYGDVGEDPNTVFVMYQCRGDSYWSNCRTCVTTALSGASTNALLYEIQPCNIVLDCGVDIYGYAYDSFERDVQIDYENDFYLSNPKNVSNRELFNRETSALLEKLTTKATDKKNIDGANQLVLYAAGEKRIGTKKVYAMVQCTKDLVFTTCSSCLEWIFRMYSDCCDGKQGGRVLDSIIHEKRLYSKGKT
ncbi:unnamed protein product [Arabidopsis thaliana]|nr:unnamed protein product [Arabidopsis thaliana]